MENAQITQIIDHFKQGGIVIVTDESDRENEGDLTIAAQFCTIDKMAFFMRYACGIICTPMSQKIADRLELNLMVEENNSNYKTAFTVSVDAKEGVTTGISASDRFTTIKALADPLSKKDDFTRPGHIFPLRADIKGLLNRDGHTEASIELCKLAGLEEVAVIAELMNDDGTVMKGVEVINFAKKHNIPILAISDLTHYIKNAI